MRAGTPRYPVDRYLVESSNKIEMVNIIGDDIWNPEPALRPEDEIILRKLHDMLQSTADDLKLLSRELSKFHEPGVQVKTLPMPLDEEFNEKVHIEEVVNAKFHGYKIVDKLSPSSTLKRKEAGFNPVANTIEKPKNSNVQMNPELIVKKPVINRNLGITRTKVIQIDENVVEGTKTNKLNNGKVINTMPAVAYNEFSYKYVEPEVTLSSQKNLHVQEMPSINIRGELKEQKVLQLDIIPDNNKQSTESIVSKSNVAVIAVEHDITPPPKPLHKSIPPKVTYEQKHLKPGYIEKQPVRKVLKMSTCDSSGSTNNVSSDAQHKIDTQKQIKTIIKMSPKSSARFDRNKKSNVSKKESEKRIRLNLDEWKKKLNVVYGQPSTSKTKKIASKSTVKKASPKKSTITSLTVSKPKSNVMNNAEYIPYSQLTLGGVRVSDIEREISDISNKHDIPLSPIVDKILSSRENSFQNESPKNKKNDSQTFLDTSDEKLLQEVIDIEKAVKKTVSKILKKKPNENQENTQKLSNETNEADNDSYADDFEDEKSDITEHAEKKNQSSSKSEMNSSSSDENDNNETDNDDNARPETIQNTTFTKTSNLSFKNSVDVYEFVHAVDTQDTATQSNTTDKILPKETQTSPRPANRQSIQPIHNDLWPSMDPKGEVEKMFQLEKEFIKKLILDEYGDLIEKNINKPSTSKDQKSPNQNVTASQKNTQTSPAHVKCVMTSPTRTKTRTTSPFISLTVERQTSPMIVVTNEEELNIEVDNDDLGISINLSSPRFSLRLPQTSKEILSNLEDCSRTPSKIDEKNNRSKSKTVRKTISSSSSVDADNSSSEISSLGEVKMKLKRKLRKDRVMTMSESSSTSTVSKYSSDLHSCGIIPLRSEGELSLGQTSRKVVNKASRSEGETSYGQTSKR